MGKPRPLAPADESPSGEAWPQSHLALAAPRTQQLGSEQRGKSSPVWLWLRFSWERGFTHGRQAIKSNYSGRAKAGGGKLSHGGEL